LSVVGHSDLILNAIHKHGIITTTPRSMIIHWIHMNIWTRLIALRHYA